MPPSWYNTNKRKEPPSEGKTAASAFLEKYASGAPDSSGNSVNGGAKRQRVGLPMSSNAQGKLKRPSASASPRLASLTERFTFKQPSTPPTNSVFSMYSSLLNSVGNQNKTSQQQQQQQRQKKPSSVVMPNQQRPPRIPSPFTTGLDPREIIVANKLQAAFVKTAPAKIIMAVKKYGTYDAAAEWLEQQVASPVKPKATTPLIVEDLDSDGDQSDSFIESSKEGFLEAKRNVQKPTMSIRQKFANRATPAKAERSISNELNIVTYTPPPQQQQPKRKLIRAIDASDIESEESGVSTEDEYDPEEEKFNMRVLTFLNEASLEDLADIAACSIDVARTVIEARPFKSLDDAREVRQESDSTGRRRKTVGEKIVDVVTVTLKGYEAVDTLIQQCERLGNLVAGDMAKWGVNVLGKAGELEITDINEGSHPEDSDEEVIISRTTRKRADSPSGFFSEKPKFLSDNLELKNYQQVGINWLALLYKRQLSCILADEMGLGKTCQVISFLAHLKEIGENGPHLVVVPSSTLENWLREFQKFAPEFVVEPYYGSQAERADIREALSDPNASYDVMVTTYNLACGAGQDLGFLKSRKFNVCVYDEGHMLKNSSSDRYVKLMKLRAQFRLILTGTPLQNNLKELVSLLSFILPDIFASKKDDLGGIFKHKAKASDSHSDGRNPLLSEQRITKAKAMMTPFVLRRKKDQVLQHLPKKTHEVVYCELTKAQQVVYDEELASSKQAIMDRRAGKRNVKHVGNVLMQLRKACLHHLLFRHIFNDTVIRKMSREIMREEQYRTANQQYIFEDMEVMTDAELHRLCEQFPTVRKHKLPEEEWMNSGKIRKLQELLPPMKKRGDRILIFSQFTQMLDILERVLNNMSITFIRLDGQTPVDVRQALIDKFYDETDITVFLLSTKAGGFGINLTCANTVIIYDLSFNPHDDKQAEDRAHRVGQTRDVRVIRMVTQNTIEENIMQLANTKLALDRSVSAADDKEAEKAAESNAELIANQLFTTE